MQNSNFIDPSTRAVIFSFTKYDIPTRYFTDINIILEISAAGFYNPTPIEVRPFKIPMKDPKASNALAIYLIRWVLCIGWIILVLITMMKKGGVHELLKWETFQDISLSLFVLSLQFYSLIMIMRTEFDFPEP